MPAMAASVAVRSSALAVVAPSSADTGAAAGAASSTGAELQPAMAIAAIASAMRAMSRGFRVLSTRGFLSC
jgi:hypothetical protein